MDGLFNVVCEKCGRDLTAYVRRVGTLEVEPCQTCLDEAHKEGEEEERERHDG
jgi:hypothetical protein